MVTLKEIAKVANVSVSTVSYALNNDSRIPEETRDMIVRISTELGYQGRSGKKVISVGKRQIVLSLNTISGSIFSEIAESIKEVLKNSNCELLIYLGSKITELKAVDGLIILNSRVSNEDIAEMVKRKIPIVVMDRKSNIDGTTNIVLDNYSGSFLVTQEAIRLGAKTFVFLGGPLTSYESEDRYHGFCDSLNSSGFDSADALLLNGDFTRKSGLKIANYLVSSGYIVDAIICANDEMAEGVIDGLNMLKIDVPKKVVVCGFDGADIHAYPGFITAKANRREWGSTVAYSLLNILNNSAKPTSVLIPVKIFKHES